LWVNRIVNHNSSIYIWCFRLWYTKSKYFIFITPRHFHIWWNFIWNMKPGSLRLVCNVYVIQLHHLWKHCIFCCIQHFSCICFSFKKILMQFLSLLFNIGIALNAGIYVTCVKLMCALNFYWTWKSIGTMKKINQLFCMNNESNYKLHFRCY